jgi:hypothetical protein
MERHSLDEPRDSKLEDLASNKVDPTGTTLTTNQGLPLENDQDSLKAYVTSLTNGDRKFVSVQDTGSCAPEAVPGRAYTVSAWYKSPSLGARFFAYYRNSAGTWTPDAAGPATVCPGLHERPEVVEEGADGCERLGVLGLGRLDVAWRRHFLLVRSDAVPLARLA